MVRKVNKVADDDGDERYVRSRVEDRSIFAKISYYMDVYKPILWALSLVLIAAGFGFSTPKEKFDELHNEIKQNRDSVQTQIEVIKARQEASLNDRIDQRRMLEFAMRVQCSSMSLNEKEKLGGVEVCDAVFNPTQHAAAAHIRAPGEPIR